MSFENEDTLRDKFGVKKRVSIVWSYFEKLDRQRVRCKLCQHVQNYQGTTGNILRHLKNKHNIDATIKGRSDNPEEREKIRAQLAKIESDKGSREDEDELNVLVKEERSQMHLVTVGRQKRAATAKITSYCEDSTDIDPYAEGSNLYENYLNAAPGDKSKQKNTPDEDRVMAEIEYFREKAGYYRMQKILTSLQAKKVKFELEQMDGVNIL